MALAYIVIGMCLFIGGVVGEDLRKPYRILITVVGVGLIAASIYMAVWR